MGSCRFYGNCGAAGFVGIVLLLGDGILWNFWGSGVEVQCAQSFGAGRFWMKYMNFLSSCSYAGLANLLEGVGIDTEDVGIALAVRLPWLLEREGEERKTERGQGMREESKRGQEMEEKNESGKEMEEKNKRGQEMREETKRQQEMEEKNKRGQEMKEETKKQQETEEKNKRRQEMREETKRRQEIEWEKNKETKKEQKMEQAAEGYFGGTYHAGAMLQGEQWFNRYLKPRGWRFAETVCRKEDVVDGLLDGLRSESMLGLRVSKQSKHAVIFREKRDGKFIFLNNRKKESKEPEFLMLTRKECLERLDDTVWVGRLEPCARETVDFVPLLEASLENWDEWWEDFSQFAVCRQKWDALCAARDKLFRAFLLDGLAVCGLIAGKEWGAYNALAEKQQERLVCLQRQYLAVMRRKEAIVLAEEMDMELARHAVLGYQEMIRERLGEEKG